MGRSVGRAGAVVTMPSGREHTVRNDSPSDALAFVVLTSGAGFERFVRAAADLLTGGGGPAELPSLAEAHGIAITRPIEAA